MDLGVLAQLITVGLFGVAGWVVSQRLRVPAALWSWGLLVLAGLLGMFVRFRLVSVFGFIIYSNWAIVACCVGILAGLTVRTVARRQVGAVRS